MSNTISIDGQALEIPAGMAGGMTGADMTRLAGRPQGRILYEITPEGHRIVPPQEKVQVNAGSQYGTMGRVIAGGDMKSGPVVDLASVDGVTFEVPSYGTLMLPDQIKSLSKAEGKPLLYRVKDGANEIVLPDQPLRVHPGDAFGTMSRVVAGGRNIARINSELELLQRVQGNDNLDWTPDLGFVKLHGWALPAGYNCAETELLICVPDQYGSGVPLRECYVNPGIRYWRHGQWVEIPHYFDQQGTHAPRAEARVHGWRYLCLHCQDWPREANFLTYLNALFTFLSNPFHNWPT